MKTKFTIAILILAFTFSCKSEDKKPENKTISTEEVSLIDTLELKMNNSKKWIANKETHIGMKRIDSILKNYTSSDPKAIGDALSKQTSYIIKSCDMKGEAHDQLHVVLIPILEEISSLKETKNNSNAKAHLNKLEVLITDYFNHFEL